MVSSPVFASRLTSSILVSGEMLVFSFCSPSLGPTSTMRTWSANARGVVEKAREGAEARMWRRIGRRMLAIDMALVIGTM